MGVRTQHVVLGGQRSFVNRHGAMAGETMVNGVELGNQTAEVRKVRGSIFPNREWLSFFHRSSLICTSTENGSVETLCRTFEKRYAHHTDRGSTGKANAATHRLPSTSR
jgi:hypothetical protein